MELVLGSGLVKQILLSGDNVLLIFLCHTINQFVFQACLWLKAMFCLLLQCNAAFPFTVIHYCFQKLDLVFCLSCEEISPLYYIIDTTSQSQGHWQATVRELQGVRALSQDETWEKLYRLRIKNRTSQMSSWVVQTLYTNLYLIAYTFVFHGSESQTRQVRDALIVRFWEGFFFFLPAMGERMSNEQDF